MSPDPSRQVAILLQEKKLPPEDYGQRLLDALSQTIRGLVRKRAAK